MTKGIFLEPDIESQMYLPITSLFDSHAGTGPPTELDEVNSNFLI